MKQLISLLALIFSYMLCGAQATTLVVDNQTPGWLSSKINYGDQQTVKNLTVTGYVNSEDLSFIGTLMQKQELTEILDLSDVKIVGASQKQDNSIAFDNIFDLKSSVTLDKLLLPTTIHVPYPSTSYKPLEYVTVDTLIYGSRRCNIANEALGVSIKHLILREGVDSITDNAYRGISRMESVSFPSTLKFVGKSAFNSCKLIKNINFVPEIEEIGFEAFFNTSFAPDTLNLPSKLTKYYTRSFPVKDGQVVVIPETVTYIDNTYTTYNNSTNIWTTWDHIQNSNKYIWIMKSKTPPRVRFYHNGFMKNFTVYVPKGSLSNYMSESPYKYANIIELIPIENIDFLQKTVVKYIGDKFKINPNIYPIDATNQTIVWSSSDPHIASIDNTGLIDVKSFGVTVITATDIDRTHSASFTLKAYEHVTSISIPQCLSLKVSDQYALQAQLTPIGKTDGLIEWSSNNSEIASISDNGIIKALKKGECIITAKTVDGCLSSDCIVQVIQPVESIVISSNSLSILAEESTVISASIVPSTANNKDITWFSSDKSVATVDDHGKITAIKGGQAVITAASAENPEIKAECIVKVLQPTTGINLDKSSLELIEDESAQLSATILPENATNKSVNWTSSDVSVAMVSPDGTVYAVKAGQATIMATTVDGGFVALCKVTVKAKTTLAESLSLSTTNSEIAIGETLQLSAIILPKNTTNKRIRWTSTNTDIATVSESGLVSAVKEGNAQIIASTTDGSNLSAICKISVNNQFVYISEITIIPSSLRLQIGETRKLDVQISPEDATIKDVNWSSTNKEVASVTSEGILTAVSAGVATIIASTKDGSNLSTTSVITVDDKSGIRNVLIEDNTKVKIFNLQGTLVFEGEYSKSRLTTGTYIILTHNGYIKRIIK